MTPNEPHLIMAPVRGITDAVYREAFTTCFGGFDRAIAPFIKLRRGHPLRPGECDGISKERNPQLPIVPQVHTNDGGRLAEALKEFGDLGHNEVNLNLGCPHPTVAKRTRGSGLLPHPDRIDEILTTALQDTSVRLSVKMRLGYLSADECIPVIEVLNRHPLTEVILHPRLATQMYDGSVDLEQAVVAATACIHPFVYNGDITSPATFIDRQNRFPKAAAWMLGRGALADPFLPQMIKGIPLPGARERRDRLHDFHARLFEDYSRIQKGRALLLRMREHWEYLVKAFSDSDQILHRIRQARTITDYHAAVSEALKQPMTETTH